MICLLFILLFVPRTFSTTLFNPCRVAKHVSLIPQVAPAVIRIQSLRDNAISINFTGKSNAASMNRHGQSANDPNKKHYNFIEKPKGLKSE
jgi:hypothetical protein